MTNADDFLSVHSAWNGTGDGNARGSRRRSREREARTRLHQRQRRRRWWLSSIRGGESLGDAVDDPPAVERGTRHEDVNSPSSITWSPRAFYRRADPWHRRVPIIIRWERERERQRKKDKKGERARISENLAMHYRYPPAKGWKSYGRKSDDRNNPNGYATGGTLVARIERA